MLRMQAEHPRCTYLHGGDGRERRNGDTTAHPPTQSSCRVMPRRAVDGRAEAIHIKVLLLNTFQIGSAHAPRDCDTQPRHGASRPMTVPGAASTVLAPTPKLLRENARSNHMELQAPTSKQVAASNVGYQNLPRNRTNPSRGLSTPASGYEQECHAAARCFSERIVGRLISKNGNARTRPTLLLERSLERGRKTRSSKVK